MIDTHYDLLTICYVCYLKKDYTKIEQYAAEIKISGVKKIFANLYFMSKEEMKSILDNNYYQENVSILEMFKISKNILERYLQDIDFIYSIEGCDYLDISELEPLYNEGLRSILIVWNNKNKYGSGNRSNDGLTNLGRDFLNKAIDLGIGIDLSHANDKTFWDIIELISENINKGKNVICYASHSNARTGKNILRNLDDKQLIALKDIGGYVGIISNSYFIDVKYNDAKIVKRQKYAEMINYITNLVGINNVMLSTDDMRFISEIDLDYIYAPIYDYQNIKNDIENDLSTYYDKTEIEKILFSNANRIINELKNKED